MPTRENMQDSQNVKNNKSICIHLYSQNEKLCNSLRLYQLKLSNSICYYRKQLFQQILKFILYLLTILNLLYNSLENTVQYLAGLIFSPFINSSQLSVFKTEEDNLFVKIILYPKDSLTSHNYQEQINHDQF